MIAKWGVWVWVHWRPRAGWLALALLTALVGSVVGAALEVNWTPEANVVAVTAVTGLLLGVWLAQRPISARLAWGLLGLYGPLLTLAYLAQLWPPTAVWQDGWWGVSSYWRQQIALFTDRSLGWGLALVQGGRSQETLVFALGLGLAGWFLAAFAAWTMFRRQRPWPGILSLAAALAVNNYFGQPEAWWLVVFIALAILLATLVQYAHQEETWQRAGSDYSPEIRLEILFAGGAAALFLMALAITLPTVNLRQWASAFQRQPLVVQIESGLERAFAGVAQPRQAAGGAGGGSGGVLPRAYVLGIPPELQTQVVMTATAVVAGAPDAALPPAHWRGLSYDVYTGRGWALSEEREEMVAAGANIPLPAANEQLEIEQQVHWQQDARRIRYTLGLPLRFDQDVAVRWRGRDDLTRVLATGSPYQPVYQANSRLAAAAGEALRMTAVADVPPAILARYTQLPPDVPERVAGLAAEVTAAADNPYDQARALERFLRQYPYSLDVPPPLPDQDPIDYFLFDLQSGYCDYYASAMAVMARSVGLPARLAVGFAGQPADESGVQTIRQIDAHSWTEIYFAGFGWVAFEPTAGFAGDHEGERPLAAAASQEGGDDGPLTAVPPRQPATHTIPWWLLGTGLLLAAGMAAAWMLWRQGRLGQGDGVVWAYGRLQQQAARLGQAAQPGQTPAEFGAALHTGLGQLAQKPRLARLAARAQVGAARLTALFNARRYAPPTAVSEEMEETAVHTWQELQRPLWLLWLAKRIMK